MLEEQKLSSNFSLNFRLNVNFIYMTKQTVFNFTKHNCDNLQLSAVARKKQKL